MMITFQNVGPQKKTLHSYNSKQTSKAFWESNTSIALYAEPSLNQKAIPGSERFHERMREFNKGSMSVLNNNENIEGHQDWKRHGGMAITAESNLMMHFHSKGKYEHSLNRWTWMRFRGWQGVFLRVISAYKPCKNRTGNHSVWTQQVNYFQKKASVTRPKKTI